MNHDSAVQLIEELHHGTLAAQVKSDLLSHMDLCRECKVLSDTYSTISDAFVIEGDHPSSMSMARYAVNPAGLEREERDRVAAHLAACATCRLELDVTREAEAEISRVQAERSGFAGVPPIAGISHLKAGLAAAILVAALGYPAYLGLAQLPRIKEKLAQLETAPPRAGGAAGWSGNVQMVVLNTLRSPDGDVPSFEIGEDPYVVLAANLSADVDRYRGQAALFTIRNADGQSVWSKRLPPESVDRNLETNAVVTVLVPVETLSPGRLTTSITRDTADGEEKLFQADFSVVRGSGAATSSFPTR